MSSRALRFGVRRRSLLRRCSPFRTGTCSTAASPTGRSATGRSCSPRWSAWCWRCNGAVAAWLIAAGAILGAGVYTYNIYPIALVAMAVALAILSMVCVRREDRAWWLPSIAIAAAVRFVVRIPMFTVWLDRDSCYWEHFDNYAETRLLREGPLRAGALRREDRTRRRAGEDDSRRPTRTTRAFDDRRRQRTARRSSIR